MEIKRDSGVIYRDVEAAPVSRRRSARAQPLAASPALHQALLAQPDVREDEVERGRQLVNSPDYPSEQLVQNLSLLLAKHWAPVSPED